MRRMVLVNVVIIILFSSRAATGVRDENLEARALAAAEKSRQERKTRVVCSSGPVAFLTFPLPPSNCPRSHRAADAAAATLYKPSVFSVMVAYEMSLICGFGLWSAGGGNAGASDV